MSIRDWFLNRQIKKMQKDNKKRTDALDDFVKWTAGYKEEDEEEVKKMNLDYKTKIKIREILCEEREANRINMLGEQIDDIVYREIEKAVNKQGKETRKGGDKE